MKSNIIRSPATGNILRKSGAAKARPYIFYCCRCTSARIILSARRSSNVYAVNIVRQILCEIFVECKNAHCRRCRCGFDSKALAATDLFSIVDCSKSRFYGCKALVAFFFRTFLDNA